MGGWQSNLSFLGASGSGSLEALFGRARCFLFGHIKGEVRHLFVRGWFVHDGGEELKTVSTSVLTFILVETHQHYLSLVSGRATGSEHTILNTAGSKVIKHSMIRHDEHASVVFVRSSPIKNALSQKHGQRRRLWEGVDDAR